MANPAFADLVGKRKLIRRTLAEALPELAESRLCSTPRDSASPGRKQNDIRVIRSGDTPEEVFVSIVFQPLTGADGKASAV